MARVVALLAGVGFLLLAVLFAVGYAVTDIPSPNDVATSQSSIVYFADKRSEIGRIGTENRISVPLDRVPQHVREAVLAAEDRSFYSNRGISPTGIARALVNNLRGRSTQGGSTITQQYAKNAFLTQDRTITRKAKEFFIAVKLDARDDKNKILEDYLNTIYFGRGAYGIQTAAQTYFGTDVSRLTVEQGAVLAALIRAPSGYDPQTRRQALAGRFGYVLDGMVAKGWLSSSERAGMTLPPSLPRSRKNTLGGSRGYLMDAVRKELRAKGFEDDEVDGRGLKIYTTIDKRAQTAAEVAVVRERPRKNAKDVHIGLAAVAPRTGRIVAMYGGPDFVKRPGVNDATARIQPGSSFKAFTLAAALKEKISLRSRFAGNSPLEVPGGKEVNNEFDQDYGSRVNLLDATAKSINTAFVDLTLEVGANKVKQAAIAAGIPAKTPGLNADARITLGTASVSAVDMAGAYATFAAEGVRAAPYLVQEVRSAGGAKLLEAKAKTTRAFDEDVCADVTYALQQVIDRPGGTGREARDLDRPAAGKTGTAALREDTTTSSWFVGYVPQMAAAVDIYKGDVREDLDGVGGLPTFFGGEYPARIWTAFMKAYVEPLPVEEFPEPARIGRTINPAPATTAPRTSAPPSPTPTLTTSSEPPSPSPTPTPTPTRTVTPSLPPPTTPGPTVTISLPPGGTGPPAGG